MSDNKLRSVLIAMTGFDGTAEELYFEIGAAALRRGYHILVFEGPGQGGVLREQDLYFRPDWEKLITPVVDYLLTKPGVDVSRIALIGYSRIILWKEWWDRFIVRHSFAIRKANSFSGSRLKSYILNYLAPKNICFLPKRKLTIPLAQDYKVAKSF
jgi:hypothetical protein